MHPISHELDQILDHLDPQTASLLEQAVRDALALANHQVVGEQARDAHGFPEGYFERTAGSFANEPLESPRDLPFEDREEW